MTVRPRGTDAAELITVIKTKALRGVGTDEDPCRIVTQYWDIKGNLLAESDPFIEELERENKGSVEV